MINKFLFSSKSEFNETLILNTLNEIGFDFCRPIDSKSTHTVWKGQKSGKNYYLKFAGIDSPYLSTLKLEFLLFSELHPEIEVLEFLTGNFLVIATIELQPAIAVSTEDIFQLLERYQPRLLNISNYLNRERNFQVLIDFARDAINFFMECKSLENIWSDVLHKDLELLEVFLSGMRLTISHGDVSHLNIFEANQELILIDWEDAFWGFRGYDELYWLTFLTNSKELTKLNLGKIDLDFPVCQSTLNVIVLLKEYLHREVQIKTRKFTLTERLNLIQISSLVD